MSIPTMESAAADFLLVQNQDPGDRQRLLEEHEPDVVGLSVMTFQRKTAKGIIDLVHPAPSRPSRRRRL